jgi:hypothetical protein
MVISAIASIALVSCASKTEQRPDWIGGSINQSGSYLAGIGSGASQEIAADRARNDLAKIVGVTIEGFERSKTSNSAEGYDSAFSSAVNTRVSQTLSGVTIAERYYDEKNELYYALAVLDRAKAAQALTMELSQKELSMDELLNEAHEEKDALDRLRLLNEASKFAAERREIAALLNAIGDIPRPIFSGVEKDIISLKRAALRSIKFSINGDYEGKRLLAEAISAAGFTQTAQSKSDYEAVGYFKNSLRSENGWQWAVAKLETEIVDFRDGATRHIFTFEAEESSQDKQTAQDRAFKKLQNQLADNLLNAVLTGRK